MSIHPPASPADDQPDNNTNGSASDKRSKDSEKHKIAASAPGAAHRPLTALDVQQAKGARKLTMLTAYDYTSACIVDASDMDMILVGDSLGMVMLGREDTISVTLDEMILHCRSVSRGARRALVVGDMPFMTYEPGPEHALLNAARMFREGGVRAVKLEGGTAVLAQVRALVQAGIPVMGHLGLTPQRVAQLGGFKVQGKQAEAATRIVEEALALQEAGCFSIVLECVPAPVAQEVTARLAIPTIGIGAGAACDGQVLVMHDLLGLYNRMHPRFVKRYANLADIAGEAMQRYIAEVQCGAFPAAEHAFGMDEQQLATFKAALAEKD